MTTTENWYWWATKNVDMLSKNYSFTFIKKYLFFCNLSIFERFPHLHIFPSLDRRSDLLLSSTIFPRKKSVACISEPRAISTYIGKSYVGLIAKMIVLFLTFDTYGWEVWTFLRAWALLYSVKSISRFLSYREDHFVDWQSAAAHENSSTFKIIMIPLTVRREPKWKYGTKRLVVQHNEAKHHFLLNYLAV